MKKQFFQVIISFLLVCVFAACQVTTNDQNESEDESVNDTLTLNNPTSRLEIQRKGGAFSLFQMHDQAVNPLNWQLKTEQMPENNRSGAVFQGHFLCLGRWGSPSDGEIEAGIPHNGEPSRDAWQVEQSDERNLKMWCEAPLDGMSIERWVKMDGENAVFFVEEKVKNISSRGQLHNIVQHATLGPPFLTVNTVVNTNATHGFNQAASYPDPYAKAYIWPNGIVVPSDKAIDLRLSNGTDNYVSTHIIEDDYGWVTANTPEHNLAIGYLWKKSEYPWINVWHHSIDDSPVAKGIEFGTTGIGKSYEDLLKVDTRFHGYNSFEYLDAGQSQVKSFICFLIPLPTNDGEIKNVSLVDSGIEILFDNQEKVLLTTDLKL
ncbi:MAG: hypothetical protein ACFCUU_01750 [Cyclobacteriaceae bacterium]